LRAVELNPYHLEANNRLGHLLQICGRVWESTPYFFVQIQRGKCRGDELLGMSAVDSFFRLDERLERAGQAPDSPAFLIRLAQARRDIFDNREVEAEATLREILERSPHLGEAQGRLGRIIVERGDLAEFLLWRGSLPEEARRHPEVLFVEGLQARRLGLIEGAVHCFLGALQLSPNHLGALTQIAGCLDQLGRPDVAREFSQRSLWQSEVERNYGLLRTEVHAEMVLETVQLLGKLGRYWEAAGWCYVVTHFDEPPEWAHRELARWTAQLRGLATSTDPNRLATRLLRAADFPSPRWPAPASTARSVTSPSLETPPWSFVDDAEGLGLAFQYFEGTDEPNRLTHIFNVVGGGVGAVDYDLDGWVDLYFAQGNDWRETSPQPQWIDRLFRNRAGAGFADVTDAAGLKETGFSHGVTVGDYDQDGFPDLHIGNLGANTLYRNNGDGTFTDVTAIAGVKGNEWSTSAVFADFNGDALPDLYVLNYTLVQETTEKICRNNAGETRACTPDVLSADDDRLYLNRGDGTFQDVSAPSGILAPDGRGLGVIAWDFTRDGLLDLFVANDTSANFLFIHQGNAPDGTPRFAEEALLRGVAVDQDGNAQASMGIAVGDANGDGRLDLFLTNFFAEANTLYTAQDGGFFTDMTRPFRLRDPSFWMLGFGCQFADFDGDGWEDLVATNGHVDQISARGDPDRMPPQLFRNVQGRAFEDVPPERLGPFFQRKYLGRGLATLDWNRDGRTDFVVSHIHAPAALVTNRTAIHDPPLVLRLAGRRASRDPVGATVTALVGGKMQSRFVTAGDGYLVTNERRIVFHAPGVARFDRIIVDWPSGHRQTWENVPGGRELLLVEDRVDPLPVVVD
jgi:tetratricopeptide (TPR) repeat protein